MAVWANVVFVIANLSLVTGTWQNVALNNTAWVSKVYTGINLPASNAVDGVTTGDGYRYAIHTEVGELTAWWKVDLQKEVQSAQVTIYFRTDYKNRRNGVQLYTSVTNSSDPKEGSFCHTVTGRPNGTDIPDVLNVTCPGTWRYLTVYTETDNDGAGAALDFVEVQVWTCTSRKYGPNCAIDCSSRYCKTASTTCDGSTGACPGGCEDGWTGIDCSRPCGDGMYGQGCNYSCSSRRCSTTSTNMCNHVTGKCSDGCAWGFMGDGCLQTCVDGMYGQGCNYSCSSRRCSMTSTNNCNHVTGKCSDGCAWGFMGNDCLQTCSSGKYGRNCALDCMTRHCKPPSSTCDGNTGRCLEGCDVGWTEVDCSGMCPSGTYGINCKSTCGNCADNNTCHHVTGACPGRCQAGWQLDLCQRADTGGTESQRGSAITPVTAGIIGLAAGICFMLILVVGLYLGLVRQGRLQWISSSQKDAVKVKETQDPVDETTSDNYTSISEQTVGRNIYNNDYAALDVEAKVNSEYDVIKNQANENL